MKRFAESTDDDHLIGHGKTDLPGTGLQKYQENEYTDSEAQPGNHKRGEHQTGGLDHKSAETEYNCL